MKTKTNKLPKRFKDKWVKALRSGKYLQTGGRLYDSEANESKGGYCCLGVVCEIQGIKNIEGDVLLKDELKVNPKDYSIPDLIIGRSGNNEIVKKLTTYNDHGKSFKWIASYIERYL